MSAIPSRPFPLTPADPAATSPVRDGPRAAQAAFFRAALQGVAPAASPSTMPTAVTAATSQAPVSQAPASHPVERAARPGALLDIRV